MADRPCPVDGCPNRHSRSLAMCRPHWYSVPKALRDELWAAFRSEGPYSERYIEAYDAAIHAAEVGRDG